MLILWGVKIHCFPKLPID